MGGHGGLHGETARRQSRATHTRHHGRGARRWVASRGGTRIRTASFVPHAHVARTRSKSPWRKGPTRRIGLSLAVVGLAACAVAPPLQIPEGAVKYSGAVQFAGSGTSMSFTAWLVDDGAQLRGIYTLLNDRGQVTVEPAG